MLLSWLFDLDHRVRAIIEGVTRRFALGGCRGGKEIEHWHLSSPDFLQSSLQVTRFASEGVTSETFAGSEDADADDTGRCWQLA